MNKKISLGAAIAFMLIVATATFSMTMIYATNTFNDKVADLKKREVMFEKFSEINSYVRQNYYGNINEIYLMDSVAQGYILGLGDGYSEYVDARTFERRNRGDEGDLVGVGAVLRVGSGGYLEVDQVYPDSPAQVAAMEPGDLVVKIDDQDVTPENSAQMLESIPGEPGTNITLVVRRGTDESTIPLTRRAVSIPTVSSRFVEEQQIGYIIIDEFGDNTSDHFNRELQKVIDQGAQSLVIDLRDNPGGKLRWTARILDKLLPAGVLASSTDRNGNTEVLYTSDANEIDLPIVVLTNEGTSGEAELFAQAIKDYGKGRTVGTLTVGKGIIQESFKLSDGSAITLTVAILNGPSGETFHEEGVKPDYEVSLEYDWRGLTEDTDPQLKKAFEVAVALHKTGEDLESEESDEEDAVSGEETDTSAEEDQVTPQEEELDPHDDDISGEDVEGETQSQEDVDESESSDESVDDEDTSSDEESGNDQVS